MKKIITAIGNENLNIKLKDIDWKLFQGYNKKVFSRS